MSFQIILIAAIVIIAFYFDWLLIKWMKKRRKTNVSSQYFWDKGTPSRRFERLNQIFKETFGTFPLLFEMIQTNIENNPAQSKFSHSGAVGIVWSNFRSTAILLGMVLLVMGQWQFNKQTVPETTPNNIGIWLNEKLFLGDPGVDNMLSALPLLILGGALLAWGLRGISLLPNLRASFEHSPLDVRRLLTQWRWVLIAGGIFAVLMLWINSDKFAAFQVPAWIASLLIFTLVMSNWDRQRQVDLSPHLKRRDWLWMIGLMFAAILLGAYRLQGMPDQLMGDEGNFWTIARDIAQRTFNPSMFSPGVYSFPVFSSMIQGWLLRLFGIDLWGWRFSSVIMGVLAIPPLYLLAREAYSEKIAVVSSIAMATSPYFIDFSRLGYNNIQALFFMTLTLYWLYIGIQRKSSLYLFLAGAMAGMGFYTYFAARFSIVISLAFIALLWLGKKITFKEFLFSITLLGLGFMLVAAPYLVYSSIADPQAVSYKMWESVFFNSFNGLQFYPKEQLFSVAPPFTINDNELFYNPQIYLTLIARGLLRTLIVFQRQGIISEHYVAFPLTGTIGALFYLYGLYLTFKTFKQPRSLLIILWFFANVLGLSALNTVPPRHTHMLAIIPALALLTGIGLNATAKGMTALHPRLRKMGIAFLVSITAITAVSGVYDFFGRAPAQYHAQPDQVISWAALDSKGEAFVYLYTDPSQKDIYPYSMEEFRTDISYETIAASQALNGERKFSDQATIVFYPPQSAEEINAALKQQWGDSFKSKIFTATDGTPVLAAGTNSSFTFEQDKTLLEIFSESYKRFSLWALLLGLLACFGLTAFFPAKWISKIPAPLTRLAAWFNAPDLKPVDAPVDDYADWAENILPPPALEEETISEPPAWAEEQGFVQPEPKTPSAPRKRASFFKAQFKPVHNESGTDYYLQIHMPKVKLPGLKTLDGMQDMISLPPIQIPGKTILGAAVLLAVIAQLMIHYQLFWIGALTYLASAAGLFVWAHQNPKWKHIFANQFQIKQKGESALLGLIILLTILTRFFDLYTRVYGIEADESKWTVQAWYSAILHVDIGEFGGRHFDYLPVDFWVRSFFLRIFGLDFVSARIESVVLSLISVICLYYLARFLTSSRAVGYLSALLFSLSFIELNASHQALHNTPPEAWMIASLAALFLALRDRKHWQFQLAGILLSLGMLTYETFYPNLPVVVLYLTGFVIYEIRTKRASVRSWAISLALFFWPIIIVYFTSTRGYIGERQQHHMGWLDYFINQQGLLGMVEFFWRNALSVLEVTFSHVVWADSLINWEGPLLNPILLPFVVIGLVYNLWNIRRTHFAFIPLWYALHILAGPILLGSPWPRVMYLAVPPLMIWGALGLWVTLAALRAVFDNQQVRAAVPVFGLLLASIVVYDYIIFRTKLIDPEERQKRRELADLTLDSAKKTPLLLFPYMPNHDDSVFVESHVLLYAVGSGKNLGLDAAEHFQQVEMNSLLPSLWLNKDSGGLDVVYDKTAPDLTEERNQILQVVFTCYPLAELARQATYFDVYHFSPQALESPECYFPPAPATIAPKGQESKLVTNPSHFQWNTSGVTSTSFALTLDRRHDNIFWLEAEDAFKGAGWHSDSGFVNDFTGTGLLLDDWQSGETTSSFDVPQSGKYQLWVRYYKRRDNDQHNFISLNGEPKTEFAANGGELEKWIWKPIGIYDLQSGAVPITLSRAYGVDEQYSIFMDAIVLSSDMNFTPDREDSIWQNIVSSGEINSSASQYDLNEILPRGDYRWWVRIFDGDQLIDANGARGIESDKAQFTIP